MKIKLYVMVGEHGDWSAYGGAGLDRDACEGVLLDCVDDVVLQVYEVEVDVEPPGPRAAPAVAVTALP